MTRCNCCFEDDGVLLIVLEKGLSIVENFLVSHSAITKLGEVSWLSVLCYALNDVDEVCLSPLSFILHLELDLSCHLFCEILWYLCAQHIFHLEVFVVVFSDGVPVLRRSYLISGYSKLPV